ncbi:hypothetical protein, partial [Cetobacterium sp.]
MLFKSKFLKVLVLTTSLCFTTTLFSQENKTQKILITDNVERAVQLSVPVKKAVVISRYNNELI